MNRWFISDTHFSHANIIGYTGRPFQSVSEMNEKLIANWNALVEPQDTVFFLGDFGLGTTDFLTSLCARLHGNKVCIRGNHDGTPAKMHKIGFSIVLESALIKIGRHPVELVHTPDDPAPPHFQLHGHVHEKRPNKLIDRQLNLSVEVWDYKPVSEKTIVALLDQAASSPLLIVEREKKSPNQQSVLIRPLQRADIPKIVDRYCFPWSTPEKTEALWNDYYEEQKAKIRTVAILEKDAEILGYGSLLRKGENPLFLNSGIPEVNAIWIDENHRRQGLGTALIKWLENLAVEEGYKQIGIGVGLYRDYGPAQQLYFRLGYMPDGNGITYKGQPTVAGQSYPLDDDLILWLTKQL